MPAVITAEPERARTTPTGGIRGDIQGLRALSVVLVIAAHAGFERVAGGYVGVDVFFVISGFLITALLMREAERTQRISLFRFYARRARRIIPAASVVLVATCVATALFLPVVRATEIFTDAVWAALFAANIRFALVETDYFASDRPVSPLQHYWSLSVEEQFYLVWPALLLLVVLSLRLRPGRVDLWTRATIVLGALVAASLAWSVWATHASPTTAYFSTFTRAWELGAGALLAMLMHRRPLADPPGAGAAPLRAQVLAVVGLGLIAVAALGFDARTPVPGVLAAVPVLGAVLLITAGGLPGGGGTLVARLLSLRPVKLFGDWSYSLYLWHFPVLIIARSHFHGLSPLHTVACLVVIVVLSGLTFHFVEEPFRRGRAWNPPVRAVALYPAGVLVVVLGLVVSNGWVDHRLDRNADNPAVSPTQFPDEQLSKDPVIALVQASVLAAQDGRPIPGDLVPGLRNIRDDTAPLGDCDYRTGTTELCPGGDVDADRTIVLLGDSHARAWSPAINAIGKKYGYTTYVLAYTGCPANLAFRIDPETGRRWTACEDFVTWSLDVVRQLSPDLALVSNAPLSPLVDPETGDVVSKADRDEFTRVIDLGLQQEIEALQQDSDQVVVLANTPKLPREQAVCLGGADDLGDCLLRPQRAQRKIQLGFGDVAAGVGAGFVDAEKWFCAQRRCPSVIGSFIPMRDSEHMTTEYSTHLRDSVARVLKLAKASG